MKQIPGRSQSIDITKSKINLEIYNVTLIYIHSTLVGLILDNSIKPIDADGKFQFNDVQIKYAYCQHFSVSNLGQFFGREKM